MIKVMQQMSRYFSLFMYVYLGYNYETQLTQKNLSATSKFKTIYMDYGLDRYLCIYLHHLYMIKTNWYLIILC